MLFWCILLISVQTNHGQQPVSIPIRLSPDISSADSSMCPLQDFSVQNAILEDLLRNNYQRPCLCGGNGWTRVAYLDMSDPNQQCPSNLTLTTTPVRGCGRTNGDSRTCDSVTYPVNNLAYSSVCGKIIAIQRGYSGAFALTFVYGFNLESAYVSGISLTHGAETVRHHVYTFAAANVQQTQDYNPLHNCACTNIAVAWPYQLPSSIGDDYFCDTGNPGPYRMNYTVFYTEDPLWNGAGCDSSSTCCEFNTPPWFCKALTESTTDDLELRLCNTLPSEQEDKLIRFIDIYVK